MDKKILVCDKIALEDEKKFDNFIKKYRFGKADNKRKALFYGFIKPYYGKYDCTYKEYAELITKNENGKKIALTEKRTKYFKLIFDYDLKEEYEIKNKNKLAKDYIKCVNYTINYYINDDKNLGYIVANKNNKLDKIHLYYPDLIVKSEISICIYNRILDEMKKLYPENVYFNNILDKSVAERNSIRPLFVKKEGENKGYEIDFNLSTYENIPKDEYEQLLTQVNTEADDINFNPKYDENIERLKNDIDKINIIKNKKNKECK